MIRNAACHKILIVGISISFNARCPWNTRSLDGPHANLFRKSRLSNLKSRQRFRSPRDAESFWFDDRVRFMTSASIAQLVRA